MELVEYGLNLKNIKPGCRVEERTNEWFQELHIKSFHNIHHQTSLAHQRGGFYQWNINEAAFRLAKSG